jgi:lipopolysaccharide transport system ATP-binding protein
MSSNFSLVVKSLSKSYDLYDSSFDKLKSIFLKRTAKSFTFQALHNVSFDVKKGDTLGIIGKNGAGKSTLLQLISGTLKPTSGTFQLTGKIAGLLELGAGFNPEFSGRENIVTLSRIYGIDIAKENNILEKIIEFSEIRDFIDRPVKTYSSGMFVRLAFSVIANVKADVLVIDEAMAVGDAKFQQKCNRFMTEFKKNGGTILFVSHDINLIRSICDNVLYLKKVENGKSSSFEFGDSSVICQKYIDDLYLDRNVLTPKPQNKSLGQVSKIKNNTDTKDLYFIESKIKNNINVNVSSFNISKERFGNKKGIILKASFINSENIKINNFSLGDRVCFVLTVQALEHIKNPVLGLIIKDRTGHQLFYDGTGGNFATENLSLKKNRISKVFFYFTFPYLVEGKYVLDIAFADGDTNNHDVLDWVRDCLVINVAKGRNVIGSAGFQDYSIKWGMEL